MIRVSGYNNHTLSCSHGRNRTKDAFLSAGTVIVDYMVVSA